MRASKPLVVVGLGVFTLGVLYDDAVKAGWITGDGQDHTVSRVPVAVSTSASDATHAIFTYVDYNTGRGN